MAAVAERDVRGREPEKVALLIAQGDQAILSDYFRNECRPLMGTRVRYDSYGNILYQLWPSVSHEKGLDRYTQVFPSPQRRADIAAPYTRYAERRQGVVHTVQKGGGRVEVGIRNFHHILSNIQEKEIPQAEGLKDTALGLLNLFHGKTPLEVGEGEYAAAQALTYDSLRKAGINDPSKLVDEMKKKIMVWIGKGETRTDVTGAFNDLISKSALKAAARAAMVRLLKLENKMQAKFIEGLEAMELERDMSRLVFRRILERLEKPDFVYAPILGTMADQLRSFIHLKGYKPVANNVAEILAVIKNLVERGQRDEVYRLRLFPEARKLLTDELIAAQAEDMKS